MLGNSTLNELKEQIQNASFANQIKKIHEAGAYTYVGYAEPGTATSSASWHIQRINATTGDTLFADGNTIYDNVWDNRTSLSYS